jgi:folate-binding protein YgfZ
MSQPLSPCRWSTPVNLIRLEGADVLRFLHGQSSQAIAQASPGQTLATALTSPTARMRGLALVLVRERAADLLLLAGEAKAIHGGLDRVLFPADQVTLGPPEPAVLVRWLGASPPAVEAAEAAGGQGQLLRPGVDLGAGADQPALLLRGQEQLPSWLALLPQLDTEAIELQRIRSGFPSLPQEINDDTNPFELGLAPWVSLHKGCYVGQETLAKLATYDGVKQQLRHWCWRADPTGAPMPERGTGLTSAEGQRAGTISSCLATAAGAEGLALVRRCALEQPQLWAGATQLTISTPPAFVPPPRAAGGRP